jgi:hypothetical protein
MIPREEWKNWRPGPEMIRAAETVFLAMAFTETIRPVVDGYKRRVLAEMQAPMALEWVDRGMTGRIILDPEDSYLMEAGDFQAYLARCREEQAKAGLHTEKPEYCPLLVAEELQRQAEHVLVEIMEPVTGITFDQLMRSGHALENLKKYLNLVLRMMAVFVRDGAEILRKSN